MKKSLIALAVASTLVAPVAMADTSNVSVYGEMNVSLDLVKNGATTNSVSANQVNSNESRLGVKGSEDLGSGMSAVFQIESSIVADGADKTASTLAGRNSFAGLKSDSAGTLTLGYQDTPYKASTRGLDLFGGGIADNRSLMGAAGSADRRVKNSINYMSPSMSGFSVAANYSAGAENASASTDTKGKVTSIAAMFDMAPFYATIAQQKETFGTAGTGSSGPAGSTVGNSDKAFKVGGSYKMDMFTVNAVVENTNLVTGAGATTTKRQNLYLAGQYNISSSDAVKLAITKAGNIKVNGTTTANSGARQTSLGYDHSLSKRTTVYALWTKLSNNTSASFPLTGDASNGPSSGGADADPSAISFGLKHSF